MKMNNEIPTTLLGFFRGQVMQQLTNGYCKISIPGILDFTDVNKLPPAECATSSFGGQNENGTFQYPELYSSVWCFFENGNANKPVYFASAVNNAKTWNSGLVALPEQESIDGYSLAPVTSVGKTSKFAQSSISQTTSVDKNTNKTLSTRIEMAVDYTPENAEIKLKTQKEAREQEKDKEKREALGSILSPSVKITLDNANNKITLSAGDIIELNAPNIIINGKGLGTKGRVMIIGDDVVVDATDAITFENDAFNNTSRELITLKSKREQRIYE